MPNDNIDEKIRIGIAKVGGQKAVAFKLEMSEAELSRKLNNERGWKLEEIKNLFEILGLTLSEIEDQNDQVLIEYLARKLSQEMEIKKKPLPLIKE
jgi:hypothetical protein